jgi:trehalose-6-phosphate synthase
LILSVGRTDYTKGGVQQLESFERLLQTHPEPAWQGAADACLGRRQPQHGGL